MSTQFRGLYKAPPFHAAVQYTNPYADMEYFGYPELEDEAEEELGTTELAHAVQLNRRYSQSLGWHAYFNQLARLLGFTTYSPNEQEFARAVARWQRDQRVLTVDGVVGPTTWSQMRLALRIKQTHKVLSKTPRVLCSPSALSPAERTALAVTTRFETGIPFGCVISKTDGISICMLQWNLKAGTLQTLLRDFDRRTGRLKEFFKEKTDRVRRLIALSGSREEQKKQREQAVQQALSEDLANRCRDAFERLCADAYFCGMLQRNILETYMKRAHEAVKDLRLQTVRGLTMMFDIAVGDWLSPAKLRTFAAHITKKEAEAGRSLSEQEKLQVIAEVAAVLAGKHVEASRRSRRLLIANGYGLYRGSKWNLDEYFPSLKDRL